MNIGIGYDGSMAIRDSEGKLVKFCPDEAKMIRTEIYRWVQKRKSLNSSI